MKYAISIIAVLFSTHAFADVTPSTVNQYCPARLNLQADIGPLKAGSDSKDVEYMDLSNSRIEGVFARSRTASSDTCLLTETSTEIGSDPSVNTVGHKRYLEFKKTPDGSVRVMLEGYTKSGKLFSIRTRLEDGDSLNGRFDALVFEGNGVREKLGDAVILANGLEDSL